MTSKQKKVIVVHDVLGTLFGLQEPIEELQKIYGEQVADKRFAELIIMDWYHAAQRDFAMLSMNDSYTPIGKIFRATLPRVLQQAGLPAPQTFSNDEEGKGGVVQRIMGTLNTLKPRPGMQQAFKQTYNDAKQTDNLSIDVWGATNGGLELAQGIFNGALNKDGEGGGFSIHTGVDAAARIANDKSNTDNKRAIGLFSCDEIKVAKPDPRMYAEVKRRILAASDKSDDEGISLWFVASHTWDVFAARKAGFKTAWITYEEFDDCKDIYGPHDIIGHDVDDVARQIVQREAAGKQ